MRAINCDPTCCTDRTEELLTTVEVVECPVSSADESCEKEDEAYEHVQCLTDSIPDTLTADE